MLTRRELLNNAVHIFWWFCILALSTEEGKMWEPPLRAVHPIGMLRACLAQVKDEQVNIVARGLLEEFIWLDTYNWKQWWLGNFFFVLFSFIVLTSSLLWGWCDWRCQSDHWVKGIQKIIHTCLKSRLNYHQFLLKMGCNNIDHKWQMWGTPIYLMPSSSLPLPKADIANQSQSFFLWLQDRISGYFLLTQYSWQTLQVDQDLYIQ